MDIRRRISLQAGVSLIEVVISISILAVGILGLLQAFPVGISTENELARETVAAQLAQAKIEELVGLQYEFLPVGTLESAVRVSPDPVSPFYNFTRTTIIELLDSNFNATTNDIGYKKISVSIFWPRHFSPGQKSITYAIIQSDR